LGGTRESPWAGPRPHVDFNTAVTHQHRRLNLIVYLNETWDRLGRCVAVTRDPYKPPGEDEIITMRRCSTAAPFFETNEHSWRMA
jgi:hypothetical protein